MFETENASILIQSRHLKTCLELKTDHVIKINPVVVGRKGKVEKKGRKNQKAMRGLSNPYRGKVRLEAGRKKRGKLRTEKCRMTQRTTLSL